MTLGVWFRKHNFFFPSFFLVDDLLGQFLQQTRVDEPVVLTISPLEIGGNDVRNFFPAFRYAYLKMHTHTPYI